MDLRKIAVEGAPNPENVPRLEFARGPAGADGRLGLALLHDAARPGQYARVYRGRVGSGLLGLPVAVKLQREQAGRVGAFKFAAERQVYLRLGGGPAGHPGRDRVVRMIELEQPARGALSDTIRPCVLCVKARHALPARCPGCGEELLGYDLCDRGVRCSRCGTESDDEAVFVRSLASPDPAACVGCPNRTETPAACRPHATLLTALSRRVLVLELLDLDLGDYLEWCRTGPPAGRADAAAAFTRHRAAEADAVREAVGTDPTAAGLDRLRRRLTLFLDLLDGVEYVHERGVVHRDLKTANVGCRLVGDRVEVKVIDFGLADDPTAPDAARTAGQMPALPPDRETALFAAPETDPATAPAAESRTIPVRVSKDGRGIRFAWPVSGADDDRVRVNDRVRHAGRDFVVTAVTPTGPDAVKVKAAATGPDPLAGVGLGATTVIPAPGPAADLFSLGMALLDLLAARKDTLRQYRARLGRVAALVGKKAAGRPVRAAVARVATGEPALAAALRAGAPPGEAAAEVYDQLLGVVLRATVRGVTGFSYAPTRDDRDGLKAMRADLGHAARVLDGLLLRARRGPVLARRLAALAAIADRLGRPTAPPANAVGYEPERLDRWLDFFAPAAGLADPTNAAELAGLLARFPSAAEFLSHAAMRANDIRNGADGAPSGHRTRDLFRALRVLTVRGTAGVAKLLNAPPAGGWYAAWAARFRAAAAARARLLDFAAAVAGLPAADRGRVVIEDEPAADLARAHPTAALTRTVAALDRYRAEVRAPWERLRRYAGALLEAFHRLLGPASPERQAMDQLVRRALAEFDAEVAAWDAAAAATTKDVAGVLAWYDERVLRRLAAPRGAVGRVAGALWSAWTGRPRARRLDWTDHDRRFRDADLSRAADALRRLTPGPVAAGIAEAALGAFDSPEQMFGPPPEDPR